MSPLIGAGATMAMLIVIYRILLRPRSRLTSFSPARAQTRARSASSGNALLMLAAVNLALLTWDIIEQGSPLHLAALASALSLLVPVTMITLIALLVVSRSLADLLIGLLGTVAAFCNAYIQGGVPAVLAVLTLTMLALFILGLARGLLRPL